MLRNLLRSSNSVEKKTFILDCPRFIFQGLIDIEMKNYMLLVAIRVFQMSNDIKGILSAMPYIGMALSPIVLRLFTTKSIALETNRVISLFLLIVAISMGVAAYSNQWIIFLTAILIAKFLYKQTLPFATDIYNQNYPKQRRGQIIGFLFTILALSGAGFSHLFGKILDQSIDNYHWVVGIGAIAALACCFIYIHMPNGRIIPGTSRSLFRSNLAILFHDRLFTGILILWSLMSFAFQMTYPLRMEYLANPRYGPNYSNQDISFLIVEIPTITRILSTFFWGKIFDTKNFAIMKIMVNTAFLVSIPLFFFSSNFWNLALASAILGIGYSGHLMAWQLWVTKIAPSPDQVGAYVSLDVAIMGFRDACAALFGYWLLSHSISLHTLSIIATGLVLASIVGFFFLSKNERLK